MTSWEGLQEIELAKLLDLPQVVALQSTPSTMDVAHRSSEGGITRGLLVIADAQEAGRGRMGRSWRSPPGSGVWCTMIEKPGDREALDVISIRVGLLLAEWLSELANADAQVKWPNDVMLDGKKLAGILTEASWVGETLAYVAVGVGVNVRPPADVPDAAGLPGADRISVLTRVVRAIRTAAAAREHLSETELARYRARDILRGRRIRLPADGFVQGISSTGALLVESPEGRMSSHRSGTIVLAEDL
jgi:BirA family transcriptional regulator, biotin operon repressor / biotin---[acetyl-CoA-carboxylase] ligase